jgi:hypothetical protein
MVTDMAQVEPVMMIHIQDPLRFGVSVMVDTEIVPDNNSLVVKQVMTVVA